MPIHPLRIWRARSRGRRRRRLCVHLLRLLSLAVQSSTLLCRRPLRRHPSALFEAPAQKVEMAPGPQSFLSARPLIYLKQERCAVHEDCHSIDELF